MKPKKYLRYIHFIPHGEHNATIQKTSWRLLIIVRFLWNR